MAHFSQNFSRPSYLTRKQSRVLPKGATFGYHSFKSFLFVTRQLNVWFYWFIGIVRLFSRNSHFLSIYFFNNRYIFSILQTFDVISGANCVLLRRRPMFKKALPCGPARYIRTSEVFSEHETTLCVFRNFFEFFIENLSIFLKLCTF